MSKLTARSIWFIACISIGLLFGYVDGFPTMALAKTALLAALCFVVYLLAETIIKKFRR